MAARMLGRKHVQFRYLCATFETETLPDYSTVTFQKVRHKSDFAQVGTEYVYVLV